LAAGKAKNSNNNLNDNYYGIFSNFSNRGNMEIRKDSALLAYREDLEERGFMDWIKVHITYEKPVHRYEGTLTLYPNKLIFSGVDIQTEKEYFQEIGKEDVQDIQLGFDEIYRVREDRLLGDGFQPLRLDFIDNGKLITAYFIIEFDRVERRTYKNSDWYDELKKWKSELYS
jgi:hypothetical protein